MQRPIRIEGDCHMQTLKNCGGYYACPKDPDGKRLGPLVGYAGSYKAPNGSQKKYVGDVYANFAKAEIHPNVLKFFAEKLTVEVYHRMDIDDIDVLCGAPIGGYSLADALSLANGIDVIKAEKKVTVAATDDGKREESELVFGRHEIEEGMKYAIVEDVCNNFSTTEKLIKQIFSNGGYISAIICFLNRSLAVDTHYDSVTISDQIPVISLVRLPIKEYEQENVSVYEDITSGNVVWKPKDKDTWNKLMKAMDKYPR